MPTAEKSYPGLDTAKSPGGFNRCVLGNATAGLGWFFALYFGKVSKIYSDLCLRIADPEEETSCVYFQ